MNARMKHKNTRNSRFSFGRVFSTKFVWIQKSKLACDWKNVVLVVRRNEGKKRNQQKMAIKIEGEKACVWSALAECVDFSPSSSIHFVLPFKAQHKQSRGCKSRNVQLNLETWLCKEKINTCEEFVWDKKNNVNTDESEILIWEILLEN